MRFDERVSNDRFKLICQYTVYSGRRNRICYKRINLGGWTGETEQKGRGWGKMRSLDDIEAGLILA